MEVTVSRLPESVLDELDDYIDELDLDHNQMRVFHALLMGYDAAWDALEEMETIQDGSIGHTA